MISTLCALLGLTAHRPLGRSTTASDADRTSPPPARVAPPLLAIALLAAINLGCVPRSSWVEPAPPGATSPTVRTLDADWSDIDPAMLVALPRCDTTTLDRRVTYAEPPDPDTPQLASAPRPESIVVYDLLTSRGFEGTIRFRRLTDPGAPAPARIEITCRVGPFGRPEIERCLVEQVARRLDDLRGVGWAPIGD